MKDYKEKALKVLMEIIESEEDNKIRISAVKELNSLLGDKPHESDSRPVIIFEGHVKN